MTLDRTEPRRPSALADLAELTKARLSSLVLATAVVGFLVARPQGGGLGRLLLTVAGVGLAALGANGLNQWWEAERDARMERTRNRPLPAGRLSAGYALALSSALAAAGVAILAAGVNLLTAALAALVVLLYVLVYTPLKTRSTLCTLVGAVCGALPPVMGWTAAAGRVEPGAFLLAGLLFAWQMPHFLSLAWLYREDYARGGFRMLPVIDREGSLTCAMVVLYSLVLIPLGLLASLAGIAGSVFAAGSALLGAGLVAAGVALWRRRSRPLARRVFLASLVYLPALLALMVADRGPAPGREAARLAEARPDVAAPAAVPERPR